MLEFIIIATRHPCMTGLAMPLIKDPTILIKLPQSIFDSEFISYHMYKKNKFTVSTELEMHHAFLVVCKVCLVIDEMKMMCTLYHNNSLNCILIVLAHWKNSVRVDMLLHSDTLYWDCVNQSLLLVLNTACLAEKQQIQIKFIVFGIPPPGSNLRSTTLEASTLTITLPMRFS